MAPLQDRSGVRSLVQISQALLLSIFTILVVVTFGWLLGIIIVIVIVLLHGSLGRISFVARIAHKLYGVYEPHLITFAHRHPKVLGVIGMYTIEDERAPLRFESRDELHELVSSSVGVLSANEKKLLTHSLSFSEQLVSSVMTPSSAITSIKKSEFLGPLTLDELHKTGHSRLPVIDQDIDHIVGVLYLQNLLALDIKHSMTAEKAMEPRVFYIREDQTLQHALAAFLRTHHHLLIVINEYRETVGLLTLEDVIEALLGRKIIDEFDSHEDKRTVALRNPHDNNEPKNHEDV
jgi:CBS domain containing-hemolysin-like protein